MSGNTEFCVRHLPVNVPDVNVFISLSATEEKHSRAWNVLFSSSLRNSDINSHGNKLYYE